MADEPRITGPTLKVLGALLSSPQDELSGAQVGRATKLASGTLYPILLRLEGAGWLQSRWEREEPSELGRPRKRLYSVTALGNKKAHAAHKALEPSFGKLSWAR